MRDNHEVTTLYGIPNCDTVKKARAWLDGQGLVYRFHDFRKDGVPADRLDRWIGELGWEKLVNRRGTTWRQLGESAQSGVKDAQSAKALMLSVPAVIKRPVVEWPSGATSVGFDAAQWQALSGR